MFYACLSRIARGTRFAMFAACAFLSGCADNSFLELTLGLPGRAGMRQHAVVRVLPASESGEFDFSLPWRGLEKNFVLLPGNQDQSLSVESTQEEVDLGMRIEFCATEFCDGLDELAPAEAWFVIRRPFTIGARTRLRIEIPNIPSGLPTGPLVVDCSGGSCVEEGTLDAALPDADIDEDAQVNTAESGVPDAALDADNLGASDAQQPAQDASVGG